MFSYTRYQSIVLKQITLCGGRHRIEIFGAKSSRRSNSTRDYSTRGGEEKKKQKKKKKKKN
jgi:hypothetical protein